MPRKRALDAVKQREVCALISVGCGMDVAARYVGCNVRTIRREALRDAEFYEKLKQAEVQANLTPIDALRKAAQTHWRAAAWFLERTQPDRFGRQNQGKFTEREVIAMIEDVHNIVLDEVKDPAALRQIGGRLEDYEFDNLREAWAAQASRPDVHRRYRRMLEQRQAMAAPRSTATPITDSIESDKDVKPAGPAEPDTQPQT